ncbi:uncharacterized protein LOC132044343 [Lycium ferocissimum]|uniref:uncharacterized protein LOC132044343 n=1 Tax=Lycium ferocissimum TaxID=112874 RepID=UPI0028154C43|nr:uncharacterized protein LOC132044343 [Lycium ferocissimum]
MWNKYCKRFRPTVVQWKKGSQTWKLMLQSRDDMGHSIWWEPRNGSSSTWFDNWSKLGALHDFLPHQEQNNEIGDDLEDLIDNSHWNYPKMQDVFSADIVEHVRNELGHFQRSNETSKPWWIHTSSGKFTVKSAWEKLRQRQQRSQVYENFWLKGLPYKISMFLWRVWFWKLPIDEVLQKMNISIVSRCWCCHIKQTVLIWWNFNTVARLKALYQAIPALVMWQLWKSRNTRRHEGLVSYVKAIHEINRNIYMLAQYRYPWLQNMPKLWPLMVELLENYRNPLTYKQVKWKFSRNGHFKCNTDGASRGNPGPSFATFCVRNSSGDFLHVMARVLPDTTNLVAEAVAIEQGIKYCISHDLLPVIIETDSLSMQKILDSIWKVPWSISLTIRSIQRWRKDKDVTVEHVLREGTIQYDHFQDIPSQGRRLINMDKSQMPNLKIRSASTQEIKSHNSSNRS